MSDPTAPIIATNVTVEVQSTPQFLSATTEGDLDVSVDASTTGLEIQNVVGTIEIQEIDSEAKLMETTSFVEIVETTGDLVSFSTTVQETQFLTTEPQVEYVETETEMLQVLYTGAPGPKGDPGGTTWPPVFAVGTGLTQNITLPVDCTIEDVIMFVEGVHQRDGFSIVGNILTTVQPSGYNIVIYSNATTPGSGSVGGTFEYQAASASTQWVINHNLECHPSVTVVDSAGTQFWADVSYVSLNTIEINFSYPMSGTAYLN